MQIKNHESLEKEVCKYFQENGYKTFSFEYFNNKCADDCKNFHSPYWEIIKHRRDRVAIKNNFSFGFDIKTTGKHGVIPIDVMSILSNIDSYYLELPFYYICREFNDDIEYYITIDEVFSDFNGMLVWRGKYGEDEGGVLSWLKNISEKINKGFWDNQFPPNPHASGDPYCYIKTEKYLDRNWKDIII